MNIAEYFDNFKNAQQITLVGPLCGLHEMRDNIAAIAEPVMFVDGGSRLRKSGQGIALGDGDSFAGTLDVLLQPDKCFSDLAFALAHIPHTFCEVKLLGFLGGRRDHELFNIGEAHHFLRTRKLPTIIQFEHEIMGYSCGQWQFERVGGFSVAVVEEAQVSIAGDCRYTCQASRFTPLSSLGLSNVGSGTIQLHCDGPAFVLFEDVLGLSENTSQSL